MRIGLSAPWARLGRITAFALLALAGAIIPQAAQAKYHVCKSAFMVGNTRYEFLGSYSSPMFNMVLIDSRVIQWRPALSIETDRDVVAQFSPTAEAGSYYTKGFQRDSSLPFEGGVISFHQPVSGLRLMLETKQGRQTVTVPGMPATGSSFELRGSFSVYPTKKIEKGFAVVLLDQADRVLYRAKFAGITKTLEREGGEMRRKIGNLYQLKPASGRGHPAACT